jgi:Fe-S cluster biosynthesis and repair protein YggX
MYASFDVVICRTVARKADGRDIHIVLPTRVGKRIDSYGIGDKKML